MGIANLRVVADNTQKDFDEKRLKAKNYYKQQVYRLLRKAKANIEEVEKGRFGVGH
jgi:predicted solute-binding protein